MPRGAFSSSTVSELDSKYRQQARTLLAVDELIKAIVDRLAARGLLSNTYIVFAVDNGWSLGYHRVKQAKGLPYEAIGRIPLFVRGPGIASGSTITGVVGNGDFAPTFAAWAGAAVTVPIDGRSFAPLLAGGPWSRQWYPIYFRGDSTGNGWSTWQGLRSAQYLYFEYASGARELYDLVQDPYEHRFWRDLGYGALSAGIIADVFGLSAAIASIAGLTFLSGAVVAVLMREPQCLTRA